jgi:hypothetical protein
MERQKLFSLSVILRGIYIGIFIIEVMFGYGLYYHDFDNMVFWILLRLVDTGSFLFLVILSYQLRQLYQDHSFDVFYKILLTGFIISTFTNFLTIFGARILLLYEYEKVIVIIYQFVVWLTFILFFIAWIKFSKFLKLKKQKKKYALTLFALISTSICILTVQIYNVFDIIDYYYPFYVSWYVLDYIFFISVILAAVVLFVTSISYILLGIYMFRNPIAESEILLYKKKCLGCGNLISKNQDLCPYCGYIYNKPK